MSKTRMVLIGAGSASFGASTLADMFRWRDEFRGSAIALSDLDGAKLKRMTRLAERMNEATGAGYRIESSANYRELLPGAEFVFVSVEVDRLERWKLDWQIPFRYGIRHVLGENGGPGGLSHALRTIDLVLGIAHEVERLAPDAYLINFTNPLARVCLALTRYTKLQVVGMCHQINKGYYCVGHILGLTPRVPEESPDAPIAAKMQKRFDLKTAGLNHQTFITDIREVGTGRDLYPEFRERLRNFDPTFEPLSRRLYHAFGLYPTSGDGHLGEYFAYAAETSELKGYNFEGRAAEGAELERRVERAAQDEQTLQQFLEWDSGERGVNLVAEILNNANAYEQTANVVNHGAIAGLPDWAVVEVPALVSGRGVTPLAIGALPPAITAALNQQIAIQDRVVEAAVHGDRQAALQALVLDPLVTSYAAAEQMLDELLAVHAAYLPAFQKGG
ncbi:MAG: alpha-glucosidase/alpha-galactosidase [Anaerolineae bacterium]